MTLFDWLDARIFNLSPPPAFLPNCSVSNYYQEPHLLNISPCQQSHIKHPLRYDSLNTAFKYLSTFPCLPFWVPCRPIFRLPIGVIGIFQWHNPSGRTMVLRSTQPLTEMSVRCISWGQRWPVRKADNLTTILCCCHEIWEP